MPNKIEIICPTDELIRGEAVIAEIVLQLDKPLKVRGVHGDFLAAEETKADYTTTTTNGKGQTQTTTHTAVEHTPITAQTNVLLGSDRLGFVGNMTDAVATLFGGGKNETIPEGEQRFQIEISIPDNAPPTGKGGKTRVFYELNAQVDIPAARDLKAKHEFSVATGPFDKSGHRCTRSIPMNRASGA